MAFSIPGLISELASPFERLVDNLHTSTEEKLAAQAKLDEIKIRAMARAADSLDKLVQAKADIIVAEAKGGVLQRTWRPALMYVIIAILANNFLVAPYLAPHFPGYVQVLALPDKLYNLLTIGLGGYVLGRSGENIAKNIKVNTLKEEGK